MTLLNDTYLPMVYGLAEQLFGNIFEPLMDLDDVRRLDQVLRGVNHRTGQLIEQLLQPRVLVGGGDVGDGGAAQARVRRRVVGDDEELAVASFST